MRLWPFEDNLDRKKTIFIQSATIYVKCDGQAQVHPLISAVTQATPALCRRIVLEFKEQTG